MVTLTSRNAASLPASLAILALSLTTSIATDDVPLSSSLRGGTGPQSEPRIPLDDVRRRTDPLELAVMARTAEAGPEAEDAAASVRRELQNGKQNSQQDGDNDVTHYDEPSCDADPSNCGCAHLYQSDYRGTLSTTEKGYTCWRWHPNVVAEHPEWGLEDGNYCRNPTAVAGRAWCMVRDPDDPDVQFDYCDVDACPAEAVEAPDSVAVPGCVSESSYRQIEADVIAIAGGMDDDVDKSHFMGGVLRLAAHDFMDYDQDADEDDRMGMDGCLDWHSLSNQGLDTIWNEHAELHKLHKNKYSDIARPDFWIIAANAIVHEASINKTLDLFDTFFWGRKEADSCDGSASRLPTTEGCQQVEGVFIDRMGLTWAEAVALLGAHTMGRAHKEFSGHHGTWVQNDRRAQTFDKTYFEEMVVRAWSPHKASDDPPLQDWTTGRNPFRPKLMLNTDVCLLYDIEATGPCCTRTDLEDEDGLNRCESYADVECLPYSNDHPRADASRAVVRMLAGSARNDDNDPFYSTFREAWLKATMNGMTGLKPVMDSC